MVVGMVGRMDVEEKISELENFLDEVNNLLEFLKSAHDELDQASYIADEVNLSVLRRIEDIKKAIKHLLDDIYLSIGNELIERFNAKIDSVERDPFAIIELPNGKEARVFIMYSGGLQYTL